MTAQQIDEILLKQRDFFRSGRTLDVNWRIAMLKKLYAAIERHQSEITDALTRDLGKSEFEGFMCEVGMVKTELTHMIRNARKFSAKRRAATPMAQFAARSYQLPTPYGNTLIMSPWNYPFLLTLDPLCNAIAAGNTAIIKPSAYSPAIGAIVETLVKECFNEEFVAVVTGGRAENAHLLEQKFDFIFFTGSQSVGKEVLRHAAEHLTPAVLELGGKSPCIIDSSAKIKLAAKRVVFGKFLNCGQTCVAPDYVLCHKDVKDAFVAEVKAQIAAQFGKIPLENPNYGKIINAKHFARLCGLIDPAKVVAGGDVKEDTLQISPTVMDNVTWEDAVMQEEIFGPILPILTFDAFEELIPMLEDKEKSLAFYFFSENQGHVDTITRHCRFGGGCVNDCIIHLATSEMGFGGVGESGMGSYHGKTGFDAFSHLKSIVDKKTWLDLPMRYQPYLPKYRKLLDFFLK